MIGTGGVASCPSTAHMRQTRAMRFRPCIDIHKGIVKQIVGSTLTDEKDEVSGSTSTVKTNFEASHGAGYYGQMYKNDNLPGGHVIMLGSSEANEKAALEALQAYPGGLQVGGGINPDNAAKYLEAGASHVIVTSYVFSQGKVDFEKLQKLVDAVGKDKLVLDLSCRKRKVADNLSQYFVVTDRWQTFTDVAITEETVRHLSQFCDEFLVHGVDVEGMRVGIQEDLVELLGKWSPITVTYAGGAQSLADLDRVKKAGGGMVDLTIGSALDIFGGDLPYDHVVAWQRQEEAAFTASKAL